jgi:hypothetical protein
MTTSLPNQRHETVAVYAHDQKHTHWRLTRWYAHQRTQSRCPRSTRLLKHTKVA